MFFEPFIDIPVRAIQHFGTRGASFAAAYAILASALLVWLGLYGYHRTFMRRIGRAVSALRHAERALDNPDRLALADTAMDGSPLGPLWRPYRAGIREQQGGPVNLVAPADWFAVERLPGRGYEAWATTWAGVFLTVGLLFTFIGLAAALLRVGDVGGGNDVDLRAATSAILQASSAKFITSIAGLLAFIGWSVGARALGAAQARVARDLCAAVQGLTTPLLPETLLFLQAERLAGQAAAIEGLAEAVAIALETRMRPRLEALPAAIAESGRGVASAVQAMGAGIGRINEAAIAQMVSQLGSDIRASVGLEMRAVSTVLREAAGELEQAKTGIASAGAELNREMAMATERMQQSGEAVEASLHSGASKLEKSGSEISAVLQSSARDAAAALGAGLASASAIIRDKAGESARDLIDTGRKASTHLTETAASAAAGLKAESDTIVRLLGRSGKGLGELQAVVTAQAAQLRQAGATIAEASGEFGKASRALRAAAKPLAATLESVERVVSASEAALERHTVRFDVADRSLTQAVKLLRESLNPEPAARTMDVPTAPFPALPTAAA